MRGDFTAKMQHAEFVGPEYQGKNIHSWLGNMHFSAVCGPVRLLVLKEGCRRLSQEEEKAYKIAAHSGPPFENQGLIDAIYASPNLGVSRPAISDRFEKQSFTGEDMDQWGPGRYVTIAGNHKRRALLCIDDDDPTSSPGGRTSQQLRQAHLMLELADGKYEKFSTIFHNEIVPYLMAFLNDKQFNPNDPPGEKMKVLTQLEQMALDAVAQAEANQKAASKATNEILQEETKLKNAKKTGS
jgi:hypothetical protein